MSANKMSRAGHTIEQGECIGIPVRYVEEGEAVLVRVDEILRLREQWSAVLKAMKELDVELAPPSHMTGGYLYSPTYSCIQGSSEDADTKDPEPSDLRTRFMSAASAGVESVSTTPPPAAEPSTTTEPSRALGSEPKPNTCAIPVELVRRGPATLKIGGQTVSYSCTCPPPDPGAEREVGSFNVWIDPVGDEKQLVDQKKNRLRSDYPEQIEGIRPGARVAADNCRKATVYIADSDALKVQLSLDLDGKNSEDKSG